MTMVKKEDLLDLSEIISFARRHPNTDIQTRHGYDHLVITLNLHNPKIHKKISKIIRILEDEGV